MTDIAITYEDGLRLSELQGQLAQLQYDMAHVDTTVLGDRLAILVLMICALCLIVVCVDAHFDGSPWRCKDEGERNHLHKMRILADCLAIVLTVVIYTYLWGYVEQLAIIGIESDMTNVQGQIDAIYAKYGGA